MLSEKDINVDRALKIYTECRSQREDIMMFSALAKNAIAG